MFPALLAGEGTPAGIVAARGLGQVSERGPIEAVVQAVLAANAAQVAPGLMKRHYSPRTPVVLHERIPAGAARKGPADVAWLLVSGPGSAAGGNIFCLDRRGDLRAAARRLFSTLRAIDQAGFRLINAELARGEGLAEAINDRLRRAARPSPAGAARSARASRS